MNNEEITGTMARKFPGPAAVVAAAPDRAVSNGRRVFRASLASMASRAERRGGLSWNSMEASLRMESATSVVINMDCVEMTSERR